MKEREAGKKEAADDLPSEIGVRSAFSQRNCFVVSLEEGGWGLPRDEAECVWVFPSAVMPS